MQSSPLGSTDGRTASGVVCHHRLWAAHTVERRRAWHVIITFGKHTRLNDVGCGMTSPPLDSTHGRHVGRGMTSPPLDNTHGRTTLGVAYHHCLWEAHTIERLQAWHAIIALRRQTRSIDVRRGMQSSLFGSTNGRTTSGVASDHSPWTANTVERRQA